MKTKKYSLSRKGEVYNLYFTECVRFWKTVDSNLREDEIRASRTLMKRHFDTTFIDFMETLGHGTCILWIWFSNTTLGAYFIQLIAELEAEHRDKPFKVRGPFTVLTKLSESPVWQRALAKWKKNTEAELNERKRREGDSDVRLFSEAKRTKYPYPTIKSYGGRKNEAITWTDHIKKPPQADYYKA